MRSWVGGWVVAAWLAALTASWAAPASANVFALNGEDPRAPSPRTGPDRVYAPVGAVVTRTPVVASDDGSKVMRTRGSAFLVSPCYVLTNFHAVFGLAFNGPDPGRDYTANFSVGADPDYMFRWTVAARPVRWGAFNKRKEHDWALLKLEGCVGGQSDIGWLDLSAQPGPEMMGAAVSLAGYPADKTGNTLWVQSGCRIEAMQDGTAKVLHECSVHGGASGGPLIAQGKAVAIQCGELNSTASPLARWDARHANTAVTVAEVLQDPEARALIEADIAAFPGPNPALDAPPPAATPVPSSQVATGAAPSGGVLGKAAFASGLP
ncbi:MAG TPA: serine protease [Caulobacteraceae bacterium]|nr:serine protease [Caulobacteraceae bacterium]